MPEEPARAPDGVPRDSGLYELARGVGALVNLVSDVAGAIGAAVSQPRTPAARPLNTSRAPAPAPRAAPPPREPLVDLFDEGDEFVLVVEWPGADLAALAVDVQDDVVALAIGGGGPAFELLLPAVADPASLRLRERNGIAAIYLRRA